jgi:hypothetical protein
LEFYADEYDSNWAWDVLAHDFSEIRNTGCRDLTTAQKSMVYDNRTGSTRTDHRRAWVLGEMCEVLVKDIPHLYDPTDEPIVSRDATIGRPSDDGRGQPRIMPKHWHDAPEISLNPWSIIDLKARSVGNQRIDKQGCRAPVHHCGSDSHRIALDGSKPRSFAGSR